MMFQPSTRYKSDILNLCKFKKILYEIRFITVYLDKFKHFTSMLRNFFRHFHLIHRSTFSSCNTEHHQLNLDVPTTTKKNASPAGFFFPDSSSMVEIPAVLSG